MFAPLRCRRGFPREPGPWQAGPPPARAPGPPDTWKKPPRPGLCRRGRARWCPPGPWGPRCFPGPAAFHGNEDRRWGPHDGPPPPPWDRGGHEQGLEDGFKEPGPWEPRPFPGPANFHGNEEDRAWGPPGSPPPPPWDDNQRPEDFFQEGCFPEPPLPGPDCFTMPDFTEDEQHPTWGPTSLPGERGGFQDGYPGWDYRGVGGKRCRRFRRSHRELTLIHRDADSIQRLPCPQPSRGNQPPSRSSSLPGKSQPKVKEELQDCHPPQPLVSLKDDAPSREQTAQDPAVVNTKVLEAPEPTSSPPKSPAADPQAATEAVELEPAAGEMLVEPAAEQKPADNHDQSPPALETEPAPPEKSSAGAEEHLKAEPCSQGVPKASEDGKSHPHGPTASPEPTEKVHEVSSAVGEVTPGAAVKPNMQGDSNTCTAPKTSRGAQRPPGSAEKEPVRGPGSSDTCTAPKTSWGAQHPPGSAEKESVRGPGSSDTCTAPKTSWRTQHPPGSAEKEPVRGPGSSDTCTTPKTLRGAQCPPGSAEKEPVRGPGSSDTCTTPKTSWGTQHPPGSAETELAASSQPQLCSALPKPCPAGKDPRSTAILAKKEEIELSYQQFSLTMAVVAAMLLQKEPSMEASLGLALKANLRQGWMHYLQELEDFINNYDSATLTR